MLRFTCGERKICSTSKMSQDIKKIVVKDGSKQSYTKIKCTILVLRFAIQSISRWCSYPVNMLQIFRTLFYKNTYGGLLLPVIPM